MRRVPRSPLYEEEVGRKIAMQRIHIRRILPRSRDSIEATKALPHDQLKYPPPMYHQFSAEDYFA